MLVEFGKAGWVRKAQMQPEKVRLAFDKIKTDGLQPTIEAIFNKLEQPLPLGYCNVGKVVDYGRNVTGFSFGDRVVSNGKHAEIVGVPKNLCAKIPDNVTDDEATFTIIGSVALQGVRLVKPTLGETIVVTGLGLIGLLTVQLLRANGCRVIGIDFEKEKLKLAKKFGAEVIDLNQIDNPIKVVTDYSRGRGADAAIITTTTKSNKPIRQATQMCRKRGRIVLVGTAGLQLSRDDFFKRELTFQVSTSYGPGRYDPNYEEKGQDYPLGYVRWTEQRNFEAVLDMMSDNKMDVKSLISHKFDVQQAKKAYELIGGLENSLGVLLNYSKEHSKKYDRSVKMSPKSIERLNTSKTKIEKPYVSFLGAGNFATATLIPAFKATGIHLLNVASRSGVTGLHAARKFGFKTTTTDTEELFKDKNLSAVVISTQHDSHCKFILRALHYQKHVYVEKPLCIKPSEITLIDDAYSRFAKQSTTPPIVMVGFNRRFAPLTMKVKELLKEVPGPKSFVLTINAGPSSAEHWTTDPLKGGGQIIGEACHFIDLLRFLAECPIKEWLCNAMDTKQKDTVSITMKFDDGSIGTINYFTNGSKSYPKERLEVFASGRILQLNNYRDLRGWPSFRKLSSWRQDKGHKACAKAVDAISENKAPPIPFNELLEVSRISIEISKK